MSVENHSPGQVNKRVNFKMYPLGDSALVVQFSDSISPSIQKIISAFVGYLEEHPFPGLVDLVPAFSTLTIYFNPWVLSEKGKTDPYERVQNHVQELAAVLGQKEEQQGRVVEIPVCYGGEFGPDLEFVAKYHQISPEEVVATHSGGEYLVYMIGFAPGFPYLGGMDPKIATPRKDHPRSQIPAGSVGIAGIQTGIYPLATPGGWQLIGRTSLCLFHPQRRPPSLLQAGDKVRFVPVSREEFLAGKEDQDES